MGSENTPPPTLRDKPPSRGNAERSCRRTWLAAGWSPPDPLLIPERGGTIASSPMAPAPDPPPHSPARLPLSASREVAEHHLRRHADHCPAWWTPWAGEGVVLEERSCPCWPARTRLLVCLGCGHPVFLESREPDDPCPHALQAWELLGPGGSVALTDPPPPASA